VSIVLDTSITLAWYFEDEATPRIKAVLAEVMQSGAIAPVIWPLEIANAFRTAILRRRITTEFRRDAMKELQGLPIALDPETIEYVWSDTIRLSDRLDLTIYDAAYLELALRLKLPIATLDRKLIRAALSEGIEAIGAEV